MELREHASYLPVGSQAHSPLSCPSLHHQVGWGLAPTVFPGLPGFGYVRPIRDTVKRLKHGGREKPEYFSPISWYWAVFQSDWVSSMAFITTRRPLPLRTGSYQAGWEGGPQPLNCGGGGQPPATAHLQVTSPQVSCLASQLICVSGFLCN